MTDETPHSPPPDDHGWPRPGGQSPPYGYGPAQQGHPYGWHQPTATLPRSGSGPRPGRLSAAMVMIALLVGLVAGGIGGVVGYNAADSASGPISALDREPQARQTSDLPAGSVEQVAERVLPSVVQLRISGAQVAGDGSGVVVSSDGLILTNNHVVEAAAGGGEIIAEFQDGREAPASIVGRAPSFDLAVVRAEGVDDLIPATLGSSDDLVVGEQVVAFGSPLGLSGTVTTGIVSALDRPVRAGGEGSGQDTVLNAIQTDAAINPGNSGGPLVDLQGRVVGINSAIASIGPSGQAGSIGLGFAIPIDQGRRVADELVTDGVATQAVLGITTPAGVAAPESGGAVVQEVLPDGAAAAAGIRPGEVITQVDDRPIESGDGLVATIRSYPPGSRVEITVTGADGTSRMVPVTLGSQQVPPRN